MAQPVPDKPMLLTLPEIAPTDETGQVQEAVEAMEKLRDEDPERFQRFAPLSRLNDRLFLGGYCDLLDLDDLRGNGITAVANLTQQDLGLDKLGFKTIVLGQPDEWSIPAFKIRAFIKWMDDCWAAGDIILIHCRAGISRTSAFAIAWLIHRSRAEAGRQRQTEVEEHWTKELERLAKIRPVVAPHEELKTSVIKYFQDLDGIDGTVNQKKPKPRPQVKPRQMPATPAVEGQAPTSWWQAAFAKLFPGLWRSA